MARRGRPRDAAAVADELRRTIVRLDDQRRLAAQAAGRALVTEAEVARACADQLRVLAAATAESAHAEQLARRAADGARADADGEAEGYDRTAAALHTAQDALDAAAAPVHALLASARDNVTRAAEVLTRSREVLDAQLREQVRLLVALEAAERARVVAAARRRER